MSDILKASVEGLRGFADTETVIGNAITTPSGVTVIPVSRVTIGIATGGVDYSTKKLVHPQSFGGGGGSGATITPVAFLTINKNSEVNLINIGEGTTAADKIASLIEHTPELIERIKASLS